MSEDQSIQTSLETIINHHTSKINTELPGTILKLYEINNKRFADVQPTIKNTRVVDGEPESIDYPVLPMVPISVTRCKNFFIWLPVQVGDECIIHFMQTSIDEYLLSDGKTIIDSEDVRKHDINDCYITIESFLPYFELSGVDPDNLVIGKTDDSTKIIMTNDNKVQIKASSVELGGLGASKALAIAEKVDQRLSALETYVITPHGSPSGPTIPTPFLPGGGGASTASTKVFTDS